MVFDATFRASAKTLLMLLVATASVRGAYSTPSLLLLGDSRDRDVVRQVSASACSSTLDFHWTAPAPANTHVAGGALCREGSAYAALGYFIHYGVSPEGPYHLRPHGWKHHAHSRWAGPGWLETDSNETIVVNSAALIVEAYTRFRRQVPADSNVVVVLASQAWDIMRAVEHFGAAELGWAPGPWVDAYEKNFTRVARQLRGMLRAPPAPGTADRLVVATSFHAESKLPFAMSELASQVVRDLASRLTGVSLLDLAREQRAHEAQIGSGLLDGVHPNPAGACARLP